MCALISSDSFTLPPQLLHSVLHFAFECLSCDRLSSIDQRLTITIGLTVNSSLLQMHHSRGKSFRICRFILVSGTTVDRYCSLLILHMSSASQRRSPQSFVTIRAKQRHCCRTGRKDRLQFSKRLSLWTLSALSWSSEGPSVG